MLPETYCGGSMGIHITHNMHVNSLKAWDQMHQLGKIKKGEQECYEVLKKSVNADGEPISLSDRQVAELRGKPHISGTRSDMCRGLHRYVFLKTGSTTCPETGLPVRISTINPNIETEFIPNPEPRTDNRTGDMFGEEGDKEPLLGRWWRARNGTGLFDILTESKRILVKMKEVLPKLVAAGKMEAKDCAHRLDCQAANVELLEELLSDQRYH